MTPEQIELREYFDYNAEIGHLRRIKFTHFNQKEYVAITDGYYPAIRWNGRSYKEHQLVWLWHHGSIPALIDHIDGVITNSSIENLRECNHSENMRNCKRSITNSTGFKGVFKSGLKSNPFKAVICVDRKVTHLGVFATPEEAHAAYSEAAKRLHGNFARTN